jgi:hypothetical protein
MYFICICFKIFCTFSFYFLKDQILLEFSVQTAGREWGRGQPSDQIRANPPVLPRSSKSLQSGGVGCPHPADALFVKLGLRPHKKSARKHKIWLRFCERKCAKILKNIIKLQVAYPVELARLLKLSE